MTKQGPKEDPTSDRRSRISRPERIDIGTDILVRNDLIANLQGVAVRTVDRGDHLGAPFIYIGNVKYRPERAYKEFLAARIRSSNPSRHKRIRKS